MYCLEFLTLNHRECLPLLRAKFGWEAARHFLKGQHLTSESKQKGTEHSFRLSLSLVTFLGPDTS